MKTYEIELAEKDKQIAELAAHCERLRENMKALWYYFPDGHILQEKIDRILNETPSHSLRAHDAQIWREAADIFRERYSDAVQSDFEHGVKWLNNDAVVHFQACYPEIWKLINEYGPILEAKAQELESQ